MTPTRRAITVGVLTSTAPMNLKDSGNALSFSLQGGRRLPLEQPQRPDSDSATVVALLSQLSRLNEVIQ
jgi:hypothetical protein